MSDRDSNSPTLYPCLRSRDARRTIAWLGEAFGFHEVAVHDGPEGSVAHAELGLGNGVLMLGSAREDPSNPWSGATFGLYVHVEDVDAHCARARAAGAEILREPADTDYGAREYSCRDPEGRLWSFGTYRPTA